jgi:Tfp pilus assembly protein PilO
MTGLIAMLVGKTLFGKTITEGGAKWLVGIGLFLTALAAIAVVKIAYDRSVISHHEAKAELKQEKAERKADTNLTQQKTEDDAAAMARQQEITNATRNIPDQAPSAQQRTRACIELRRQSSRDHKLAPAC